MIEFIDDALNRVTMYRLVLYYLIFLLGVALLLSFAGVMGYDPFALLFTTGFLLAACSISNWIFARAFAVAPNAESTYITALILALIISPLQSYADLWFLGWAAVLAMASKYIVAIGKKHIFNPAAFAVALTYVAIDQSASWWIGSAVMLPFVLAGGVLVVRKLQRADLVVSFLLTGLVTILLGAVITGSDWIATVERIMLYSPAFFFAFIILTEPLTSPQSADWRVLYGALVGLLFVPEIHIGGFFTTPEFAILIGNIFAYLVSPKRTLVLQLKRKTKLAPDVYDFVFAPPSKFAYAPGQYMEWTLGHADPDSRGNRRYFTLASSPTESNLRLGVKFYDASSSFKQALLSLDTNSEVVASQLAGDFTLPRDPKQKCVFIAGGIGITPFRSMIKYLLDKHERRPVTLFYAGRTANELVYLDIFEKARSELGIKTIYTITDSARVPSWWQGKVGRITPALLKEQVPDYKDSLFYISGPKSMVDGFKALLRQLNVAETHIKTDFFQGLA